MIKTFVLWLGLALLIGVLGKERKIGFGGAFFWAVLLSPIIGLVITLLSKPKESESVKHRYRGFLEQAQKAEYKNDIEKAIDNYKDALYHLEHDYPNLQKKDEQRRVEKVLELKSKVDRLSRKSN